LAKPQTGKRQLVVVTRERKGRTLPFVFKSEGEAVHADKAALWDKLHMIFLTKRINHQYATLRKALEPIIGRAFSRASAAPKWAITTT
jgi:hypothetical protein